MAIRWKEPKDPDEVVDYAIDWYGTSSKRGALYGTVDTIVSSTWTPPADSVTVDSNSFTDRVTIAWFSGGAAGQKYSILNRVVTAGGRTFDRTAILRMKDK